MQPALTRILDSQLLMERLVDLAKAGHLTPERVVAIAARVSGHLVELKAELDDPEWIAAPLPTVERPARFHGHLAVFDGGRA